MEAWSRPSIKLVVEEVRAVQAHLAALADGELPPAMTAEPPNLAPVSREARPEKLVY